MLREERFTLCNREYVILITDDGPYFKAADLAEVLEYVRVAQSVRHNVKEGIVKTYDELINAYGVGIQLQTNAYEVGIRTQTNAYEVGIAKKRGGKSPLYVNELGMSELIFKSVKPAAIKLRTWFCKTVLPSLHQKQPKPIGQQMLLIDEQSLQYAVVKFIRSYWKEAIMLPGLGEWQKEKDYRDDAYHKGYTGGQPDLFIANPTDKYHGLAIEFKTPKGWGEISQNQLNFLSRLSNAGFKTLISNDYTEILMIITEYKNASKSLLAQPPEGLE